MSGLSGAPEAPVRAMAVVVLDVGAVCARADGD
jgi:hypothetical protein